MDLRKGTENLAFTVIRSLGRPAHCESVKGVHKRLRWSRGSVLAFGTQVRAFEPSHFSGRKNPQHAFLRKGSKAVCPMS